jgi:hypothetical protein
MVRTLQGSRTFSNWSGPGAAGIHFPVLHASISDVGASAKASASAPQKPSSPIWVGVAKASVGSAVALLRRKPSGQRRSPSLAAGSAEDAALAASLLQAPNLSSRQASFIHWVRT